MILQLRYLTLLVGGVFFLSLMPAYALSQPYVHVGALPSSSDVVPGGSVTLRIITTIGFINSNATIIYNTTQLPEGVTVTFNPNPIEHGLRGRPEFYTNMTVKVSEDIQPGTNITFKAKAKAIVYRYPTNTVDFVVDSQRQANILLNVKRTMTLTSTTTSTAIVTSTSTISLTSTKLATITVLTTAPNQTLTTTITNTVSSITVIGVQNQTKTSTITSTVGNTTSVIVRETSTVIREIREGDAWIYSPIGAGIALAGLFIAVAIFRRK